MTTGIPGPLPKSVRNFRVIPRYNGRRTFFNVESDTDTDLDSAGKRRVFWNIERAQQRADELNADELEAALGRGGRG